MALMQNILMHILMPGPRAKCVRCSNLANYRFTLVFSYRHCGMNVESSVNQRKVRKTELVISHSQLNSARSS